MPSIPLSFVGEIVSKFFLCGENDFLCGENDAVNTFKFVDEIFSKFFLRGENDFLCGENDVCSGKAVGIGVPSF